jgi:hypothetical protein
MNSMPDGLTEPFRPPAVPLVVVDPYFSVWSMASRLTDEWPRHWTGANHPLGALARIDGHIFRFMGPAPDIMPVMEQVSVEVLPTRTIYLFRARGVEIAVTFLTPALPHDLTVFSWPVTYILFDARSIDGLPHDAAIYFEVSAELAVDQSSQQVVCARHGLHGLDVLSCGSLGQRVLEKSGDDLRIDWGHLYLAVPARDDAAPARTLITSRSEAFRRFVNGEPMSDDDEMDFPCQVAGPWPRLVCEFETFALNAGGDSVNRFVLLAYDDLFSLEYHHRRLRPYWRRANIAISQLLKEAVAKREELEVRCAEFDKELMADLTKVGGEKYARLCALAHRQTAAGHKLAVDADGTPVYFSKECFSNGCINTVDVTYPSAPFFLLFNPNLLEAQIGPIFDYARTPRWKFPFAPHDLGTYPQANGQVYGGGELTEDDQMPVEECGNMILLTAALIRWHGDPAFAAKNHDLLRQWAEYLRDRGFDPEKQLCTDDFAGRLAHNTNLSLKAILALAAYSSICGTLELNKEAVEFRQIAEEMAKLWVQAASDGDHYRLAFDRPGTWSLKYNLVWDRLLELDLFPAEVARKEVAFYRDVALDRYGLPLDNRKPYTLLPWQVWCASLAEHRETFDAIFAPTYAWAHETPSRVPLPDWFWTTDGRQATWGPVGRGMIGFQARTVVGGIFIKLLGDPELGEKWREISRAAQRPAPNAGLVPTAGGVRPIADRTRRQR